jgi:hypothetical protein
MPTKIIPYRDATVTIHAPIFGGEPTVDVACRNYEAKGLTLTEFAAMIYPAISAAADSGSVPSHDPPV